VKASPLARKLAEQHGVDIALMKTASGRVEKADVLAYVESHKRGNVRAASANVARLAPASPKARRLAGERGGDLHVGRGTGPSGAVLAGDVPAQRAAASAAAGVSNIWRIMAERMTHSWTTAPHFYLVREVNASRLMTWRERAGKAGGARITYTDLLVRLVAAAPKPHPPLDVSWEGRAVVTHTDVNVGLAVAPHD